MRKKDLICDGFTLHPLSQEHRSARHHSTASTDDSGLSSSGDESEQEHWSPDSHAMDAKVQTSLKRHTNKQMEGSSRAKDRSDRATVETVLDPRTRMVLSQSPELCSAYACQLLGRDPDFQVSSGSQAVQVSQDLTGNPRCISLPLRLFIRNSCPP